MKISAALPTGTIVIGASAIVIDAGIIVSVAGIMKIPADNSVTRTATVDILARITDILKISAAFPRLLEQSAAI